MAPLVEKHLTHPKTMARQTAAVCLWHITGDTKKTVPVLVDALKRCGLFAESLGLYAVEVRALDERARGFYLKYGFAPLVDDPLHLYLSMKAVRQLGL